MAISFFVLLGVIRHKGVEIQGGRGFRVERRSDRENQACQFGKKEVLNGSKNCALTEGAGAIRGIVRLAEGDFQREGL